MAEQGEGDSSSEARSPTMAARKVGQKAAREHSGGRAMPILPFFGMEPAEAVLERRKQQAEYHRILDEQVRCVVCRFDRVCGGPRVKVQGSVCR
jgi:hypothetical protein